MSAKQLDDSVAITGVWLKRLGDYNIVSVEIGGRWVDVIREHWDGSPSHIVEPAGIRARADAHT